MNNNLSYVIMIVGALAIYFGWLNKQLLPALFVISVLCGFVLFFVGLVRLK